MCWWKNFNIMPIGTPDDLTWGRRQPKQSWKDQNNNQRSAVELVCDLDFVSWDLFEIW
jgi:hypothetical protein